MQYALATVVTGGGATTAGVVAGQGGGQGGKPGRGVLAEAVSAMMGRGVGQEAAGAAESRPCSGHEDEAAESRPWRAVIDLGCGTGKNRLKGM